MTVRHARSDDGMTITELLVAMLVLSIVTAMVVTFFATVTRTFTTDSLASSNTNVAANGMNSVTRIIRAATEIELVGETAVAPVFESVSQTGMTLYTFYDNGTAAADQVEKVTLALNTTTNSVTEVRVRGSQSGSKWTFTATQPMQTLATSVAPRTSSEAFLFTYLDGEGVPVNVGAGSTNRALLGTIASVKVNLTVQMDGVGRAGAVNLQNTVVIPNLGISRVGHG
jgi:prepilin-type N-terminal cleavage/methylation domain-containing protein